MQKPFQFQLSLEQTSGDKGPAAKLKQRNGPARSAEGADSTKQARGVIKYVAQAAYSVDRTDCLIA